MTKMDETNLEAQQADTQLIYTKLGNIDVTLCDYSNKWEFTASGVMFYEEWKLKSTGEVVRNNSHGYMLPHNQTFEIKQGNVNG
jgi:hypothetical protein